MKKILLIILGILLITIIPMVMASVDPEECADDKCGRISEGDDLLILDVEVQIDGSPTRSLDYGDDITRKDGNAKPESELIFEVKVWNNMSDDEMEDVYMNIEIDDLFEDEDSKDTDEENIDDEDDYPFELTFKLPSDTEEGEYDVVITVTGENSSDEHSVEYELVLVVEFDEEQSSPDSLTQKIDSLNSTIGILNKDIGSYFKPYATCVSDRDSYKETIKTRDTTIASMSGYETKFTICNTNLLVCNTERAVISAANESCNYMIQNEYIPEIKSKENWAFLAGIIGAGGVFLIYWNKDRKKKEGTEEEETPSEEDEAP